MGGSEGAWHPPSGGLWAVGGRGLDAVPPMALGLLEGGTVTFVSDMISRR